MIGLEWIAQKFFIACDLTLLTAISNQEPVDVLLDHPEAYFAAGPLRVPSQPIRDVIHVSIFPNTKVGIDIRNMGAIREWTFSIGDERPKPVPEGNDFLEIGTEPKFVRFFFRGNLHTTIQFFVENGGYENEREGTDNMYNEEGQ